jgi:hypothetical protein
MPRRVTTGIVLLVLALPVDGVAPAWAQEPGASAAGTAASDAAAEPDVGPDNDPAVRPDSSMQSAGESKLRQRSTIILAMLVAGIALTGLLLLIAAIVVRGFLRNVARRSEAQRGAELALPPDVATAAAEDPSAGDVDESVPFSERETEVT